MNECISACMPYYKCVYIQYAFMLTDVNYNTYALMMNDIDEA